MTTAQAKSLDVGRIVRRFDGSTFWDGEVTRKDGETIEITWDDGLSDQRTVYEFARIYHSPNQNG